MQNFREVLGLAFASAWLVRIASPAGAAVTPPLPRACPCGRLRRRLRRPTLRASPFGACVHLARIESARRCWLHVHRDADHAKTFNEALRRKFTCVAAHPFVGQDSRTSVAHPLARRPLATSLREATCGRVITSGRLRRGSLRKAFAFLRCISTQPAVLSTCHSLR